MTPESWGDHAIAIGGVAMSGQESPSSLIPAAIFFGAGSVAVATLLAAATITLSPGEAQATVKYAEETGLPCGKCHVNPGGGGKRTAFGDAFVANGHKVPKGK
jgi:hypothetical protein